MEFLWPKILTILSIPMLTSDNKVESKTSIIGHGSIKFKTDYNPFEINNLCCETTHDYFRVSNIRRLLISE